MSMKTKLALLAATGLAVTMAAPAAVAQKSKNTVRVGLTSAIKGVDNHYDPKADTQFSNHAVYDTLMFRDEKTGKIVPLLAKSVTRVDPKTLEIELRDGVKWHDGEAFDADDVVYTVNWLTNKGTKIRMRRNYTWIAGIEKLGPMKVRISAKRPTPFDLLNLASFTWIYPEHLHNKLEDKADFGRKSPVGTGPYRVAEVTVNRRVVLEKNKDYKQLSPAKRMSNVDRFVLAQIPDVGTQIAQMLAGNLDALVRVIEPAQAIKLAKDPRFNLQMKRGVALSYLAFDAKGRSGAEAMKNIKVRKAIMMAIDRGPLTTIASGGDPNLAVTPGGMCWKGVQGGCDWSASYPKHDPEAAKKLLAEAGFANGLEVEITSFNTGVPKPVAVAISAQLRKVGITSRIDSKRINALRKKMRDGKIQMLVGRWSGGGLAEVSSTLRVFYSGSGPSDWHGDGALKKMARKSSGIMDPVKRKAAVAKALDHATENAYYMALTPSFVPMVHVKELEIDGDGSANTWGANTGNFNWK